MRLEQVEQRAFAFAEVVAVVVEEEGPRVRGRRGKGDLELEFDARRAEVLRVDLEAMKLAAAVEVRQLEGVVTPLHLGDTQRVLAHELPEDLIRHPVLGDWDLDQREEALTRAVELAVAGPFAAEQRAQALEQVWRERVRADFVCGFADEVAGHLQGQRRSSAAWNVSLWNPRPADNTTNGEWTGWDSRRDRRPDAFLTDPGGSIMLKRLHALALCVMALLIVPAVANARAIDMYTDVDAVTDWNVNAVNALVGTAGQSPTVSTVHLAMVHGAVYDAVNSIDERYEPYLVHVRARDWYSQDAAAATAAYRVLLALVPAQQPTLATLYDASLAPIPAGEAKQGGIRTGEIAAAAMLAARTGDGRNGAYRFPAPATPQDPWPKGQWRPVLPAFVNDPAAWIKDVRPFLIRDPHATRATARIRSRAGSTRASSTRSRRSAR